PEQAGIAAQLPTHEDGGIEPLPVLVLERLHHPHGHLQAPGHLGHVEARRLARLAQSLAVAGTAGHMVGRLHGVLLPPGLAFSACGNSVLSRSTYRRAAALPPSLSSIRDANARAAGVAGPAASRRSENARASR